MRTRQSGFTGFPVLGLLFATSLVLAEGDPGSNDGEASNGEELTTAVPDAVPVTVRREKPDRLKKPTLRFLQENLDFLRAQIDGVHWEVDRKDADGSEIDPRWSRYLEIEQLSSDSRTEVGEIGADAASAELMESVADLVAVEGRLQRLSIALDDHETRLHELHTDYVEDHTTSLVVLLEGQVNEGVSGATLAREDGHIVEVSFDAEIGRSLGAGAVVELDHDFVEPRWQWLELSFRGDPSIPTVYLEIQPRRDQLNFVQIDLESVQSDVAVDEWDIRSWSRPLSGSYDWTW